MKKKREENKLIANENQNKQKLRQIDEINDRMQNNMTLLNEEMERLMTMSNHERREEIGVRFNWKQSYLNNMPITMELKTMDNE